jgi:hypothetical protein
MSIMTIKDVEKLQTAINDAGLDYDVELTNGKISIVGPSDIVSQSDRIKTLKNKILNLIKLGAIIGILIDPDEETVTVYRSQGEPIVFHNGDILTLPELFPGWELAVSELWPPIFTEEEIEGLTDDKGIEKKN